jgi:uncharacterized protein YjbI with pentapeptide repeats
VDLSGFVSTDDQNISGSGLAGTVLTIGIEGGTSETVDLASIDTDTDTDDQTLSLVGTNLTIADGNTVDLASIDTDTDTDDQTLSLAGNTLSIADGNSVDLSGFVSTDDQNISGSGLAGTVLTIGIEGGTDETVDLATLVGTDDQNLTGASLSGANVLQIDIENGGSTTVDLSALDDSGTDDQNISGSGLSGTDLTIGIENGTNEIVDLSSLVGTDDQTASEVNSDTPVDVDGDGNTEATVEDVIQDIAPITSKAARIFYPPSIAVDASTNGNFSIDLYAQYIAQYGTPTVASAGAPAAVPTYAANEIYYYVTYADPTVFNTGTMSIDGNGVLSYTIIGQPADYNALINVVFVVK